MNKLEKKNHYCFPHPYIYLGIIAVLWYPSVYTSQIPKSSKVWWFTTSTQMYCTYYKVISVINISNIDVIDSFYTLNLINFYFLLIFFLYNAISNEMYLSGPDTTY